MRVFPYMVHLFMLCFTALGLNAQSILSEQPIVLQEDSDGGMSFIRTADLKPDSLTEYALTFRLRSETVTDEGVLIWVNLLDADSAKVYERGWRNLPDSTGAWTTHRYTLWAPRNVESVKLGGGVNAEGKVWVDDLVLEPLDQVRRAPVLSDSAEAYIADVVDSLRKYAVNQHKLEFTDLQQLMRYRADSAQTVAETYEAIQYVTQQYLLDNHHSNFFTPVRIRQMLGGVDIRQMLEEDDEQEVYLVDSTLNVDSLRSAMNFASGRLIDGRIGYLSLPFFMHGYRKAHEFFADSLQQLIKELDQAEPVGWVVDLRDDSGGAVPTKVVGIGPLLDSDNLGAYVSADGTPESQFFYRNGSYCGQETTGQPSCMQLLTDGYRLQHTNLPVAVLSGQNTASAGEIVLALLKGQPRVRQFGQPTFGLTTGNQFVILPDLAALNISTSYLADRHGVVYRGPMQPEVIVERTEQDEDASLNAALKWILEK